MKQALTPLWTTDYVHTPSCVYSIILEKKAKGTWCKTKVTELQSTGRNKY